MFCECNAQIRSRIGARPNSIGGRPALRRLRKHASPNFFGLLFDGDMMVLAKIEVCPVSRATNCIFTCTGTLASTRVKASHICVPSAQGLYLNQPDFPSASKGKTVWAGELQACRAPRFPALQGHGNIASRGPHSNPGCSPMTRRLHNRTRSAKLEI